MHDKLIALYGVVKISSISKPVNMNMYEWHGCQSCMSPDFAHVTCCVTHIYVGYNH